MSAQLQSHPGPWVYPLAARPCCCAFSALFSELAQTKLSWGWLSMLRPHFPIASDPLWAERSPDHLLLNHSFRVLADSGTEIAIVLDGSGSIDPEDFERAKAFIYNMMKAFYEKCFECDFALVQYGSDIRTEFNLQDSWNANATLQNVQNITQLCNVTKTASAIQHVLDSIFNESQGSQKNAAKIMVVLTDGEIFLDPMNLTTVINSPKMARIDRYAIGVGKAFNKPNALSELRLIASDPDESHLFRVTNYSALDGLLSTLQQKIIAIEGTAGDVTEYELAQTGFSAQILDKQHILVGAVGAYDWSGGVLLYDWVTKIATFLNESKEAKEVGSYFGSELCSVDVNQDEETDYLLVGAPLYHIHGEEGRVYVYQLKVKTLASNGFFSCVGHLSVQAPSAFARFGFTVASIGDINKDGYVDVAVGAPLEDRLLDSSTFGSIYIYNGDKNGIRSTFSQRIRAAEVAPGLQYFGQSIDGGFDFTDDSLIDITVGSFGNVTVLRSRPVVRFDVTMRFTPERIFIFHNNSIITAEFPIYLSCLHIFLNFVLLQPCDYDCFSSITLKVSYQLSNSNENMDHPAPMLDIYQEPEAYFQVPYKKDCNNKAICAANLTLRSQTQKKLVVGDTKELTMDISLVNSGDDSYMTTMVLKYPRNLQFKKMIPKPSSTVIHCNQPKLFAHLLSCMGCKIGHPIFRKTAVSQMSVSSSVFILFSTAAPAPLSLPTPVVYVNVSQGHSENKEFQFNINGENRFRAQIELEILVPIRIQGHSITRMKNVTGTQASNEVQCQCVHCVITSDRENITVITELPLIDSQQILKDRTDLLVTGEITFNKYLYEGLKEENHRAEITVVLLKTQVINTLPVVIGSSVGGFLLLAFIIFILFKVNIFVDMVTSTCHSCWLRSQ
uniref:Integrin subunit alpha E n=1 Tax=Gopherus evgoodei TaxID=1825980 RepID=A0A8C4WAF1_9SAUR